MKKKPLNQFEAFAQRMVEGSFRRLFGSNSLSERLNQQLADALETVQVGHHLPEHLTLYLATADLQTSLEAGHSFSELASEFQAAVHNLGQLLHLYVPHAVTIRLVEDGTLSSGTLRLVSSQDRKEVEQATQVQKRPFSTEPELSKIQKLDAYLIVAGHQHVLLTKPLLTIGRLLENDVVLDDATISRKHAQIRWRLGRFVLYDLSNRGRTIVNGIRVTEHALEPGDVIALSHMMLIYGEGRTRPQTAVKKQADADDVTRPLPKLDQE